jgi:hypothetical protein
MAIALSAALLLTGGCQQTPRRSGGAMAGMPMLSALPPPTLTSAPLQLSRPPPEGVDQKWFELDEFFPPGARRVGPNQRVNSEILPDRRTRFPSTDLCVSPNKHFVLFHDGMKRRENDIFHWLMLLKHDATFPNAIFLTKLAFDVSWAENSRRFAVTHFVGDNSSEVFIVDTDDLARKPIAVGPSLEEHFAPHLSSAPMFVKVYRWTRDGQLIVRAIGRAREEPYELFGAEIGISFAGALAEPQARFLRGYIKDQENR